MRGRLAVLLPVLLFAALHLRTLDYGFTWVDEAEIVAGSILRPPGQILAAFGEPLHRAQGFGTETFSQSYYRPFQVVTASALDAAFGRTPRTFRALSLVLGALTASLFAALALTLFGDARIALFAGALFAVHPVLLEIYVWIAGLSAAWWASRAGHLLAGLRAERPALRALSLAARSRSDCSRRRTQRSFPPSGDAAAGAMAHAGLRLRARRRAARRRAGRAGGAAPAGLRPAVLGTAGTARRRSAQPRHPVADEPGPVAVAALLAVRAAALEHQRRGARGHDWSDPATLTGIALALGSAALCAAWWLRTHAVAAASLAWLWLAFLPTSGLAPLLHARAERNLFLSWFGATLLLACGLRALLRTRAPRAAVGAAALLLLLALAQRSFVRAPDWRSTQTLFEHDVAADPRHREGRVNLIVAALVAGDAQEAKRHADVLPPGPRGGGLAQLPAGAEPARAGVRGKRRRRRRRRHAAPLPARAALALGDLARRRLPRLLCGRAERQGRCADALPIYKALYRGSGKPEFAEGAARCEAEAGR